MGSQAGGYKRKAPPERGEFDGFLGSAAGRPRGIPRSWHNTNRRRIGGATQLTVPRINIEHHDFYISRITYLIKKSPAGAELGLNQVGK